MEPPLPPLVHERTFRLLGAYAVALASAQTLVVATGLAHVAMGQALAVLVIVASIAAGWRYAVWLGPSPEAGGARSRRGLEAGLAVGVVAIVGILYVLCWISAIAKPDLSWDGNSYHVPMVHFWARRGYVHWVDFDFDPGPLWGGMLRAANAYPKGAETVDFLLVRAFGNGLPVNTNNLVFFPVGVAGVAAAGRALGASRLASWTAGAALGLVPTIVAQQMTAYVDASFAESVAALVGCVGVAFPLLARGDVPWKLVPAVASSMGLAAAAKGSGVAPAMLAMGLLALASGWAVRATAPRSRALAARRHLAFSAAVAAATFAVTGYWYARNWYYAANPLAPVRIALLGHEIFPGVPLAASVSEDALTPPYMATWPAWKRVGFTWLQGGPHLGDLAHQTWFEWSDAEHHWPRSIRWYDAHEGGLGYLWVLVCLPAITLVAAAAWRRRRTDPDGGPRLDVFVPMAVVVLVSFLVTPMNWWARYTLGLFALGLPCLAYLVDRAARVRRLAARVALGAWLASAFAVATFEAAYQFRYSGLQGGFVAWPWQIEYTPAGLWHALLWYREPVYFYPLSPMDKQVISRSEPVALGSFTTVDGPWLGQLSMPPGLRDIVFVSPETAADEQQLRALFARHHVRWVYWQDGEPTPPAIVRLATDDDHTPGFWRVYEVGPADPLAKVDVHGK
jgi:hypothetical protein